MKVDVLNEAGFEEALLGLSLSYNSSVKRADGVIRKLAHKQGGHNKSLEAIMLWLDVTASRCWWSQADTYRISSKQSESTMHTLLKKPLTQDDFLYPIPKDSLAHLNLLISEKQLDMAKNLLPEGFLQRRIWTLSYKTLQNIYNQRKSHKLLEWKVFCNEIIKQVAYPELIAELTEEELTQIRGLQYCNANPR